jgi:hypothetical protein
MNIAFQKALYMVFLLLGMHSITLSIALQAGFLKKWLF